MTEGTIYIIGAGPGDPDLITLKAMHCMEECQVIFYEESISKGILAFAPPEVAMVKIAAGPTDGTVLPAEVNQSIISEAKKGRVVGVILEGDPFIFGLGAEVARQAVKAGIRFVPVPGITSASAAAVYAGIPLTYRGYASTLAFAIGHSDLNRRYTDIDWPKVATGMQTLVFFINEESLGMVIDNLLKYGRDGRTPAAIVSAGTCLNQRTIATTLKELQDMQEEERQAVPMPAILIVGDVVGLRKELRWFE